MKTFVVVKYIAEYRGAEYPPAPLKLLQAIIASSKDKYLDVLKCLEAQIPVIHAVEPKSHYEVERYVINNDERLVHNNSGTKKRDTVRMFSDETTHLVYEYEMPEALSPEFNAAIAETHTLGRAGDWVFAAVLPRIPIGKFDTYVPAQGGTVSLRAALPGSVSSLFAHYKSKAPVLFRNVAYTKNPSHAQPRALFSLTEPVPAQQATVLVAWIRHALIIAGVKGADGHENSAPRLQIVPLPTLDFNDNMIRRVALVSQDSTLVKAVEGKGAGLLLTDSEGENRGYLMPAEFDAVCSQYMSPGKRWVTVTPLLQSGFHNDKVSKKVKLYNRMFRHAGLPQPVRITEIGGRTDDYKVSAKHGHDKLPRVRLFIEFAEEVPGPITLGTGRYAGLGVFAQMSR